VTARSRKPRRDDAHSDVPERAVAALESLPALQRDAVVVAFYGRRTYKQTAALLERPEHAVRADIRAALHQLHVVLDADLRRPRRPD